MKSKTIARVILPFCLLQAIPLFAADSDTNTFPVLTIKGHSYTNARISSVSAAYAIVIFDGGGKRVPLADLPEGLQKRYGYEPAKAATFVEIENEKRAATTAEIAASQLAVLQAQNSVGEEQNIRILKITGSVGTPTFQIRTADGEQEALFTGLPPLVENHFASKVSLAEQIQTVQAQVAANSRAADAFGIAASRTMDANAQGYWSTLASSDQLLAQQQAARNAVSDGSMELIRLRGELQNLNSKDSSVLEVVARPTGKVYGGKWRIWKYVRQAALRNDPHNPRNP